MGAFDTTFAAAYAVFDQPGLFGKAAVQSYLHRDLRDRLVERIEEGEKLEVDFYVESVPDPGIDWTFEYKDSPAVNRLKDLGDFNVEVPVSSPELREGENELVIRIVDGEGHEEQIVVGFNWDPSPLPVNSHAPSGVTAMSLITSS